MTRHLGLVAALAMAGHALTFWGAGPFDDDFICYRYARNLIEGHGLVFQPGERIEGFTNPLWVLLVAGALKLGLEPTLFSRVVGVLAAALCVWAVDDAWRRRNPERRLSPALVVAALPPMAWHAVTGLGTTLLAALLVLWLRAWDRARLEGGAPWLAGVWLALACLLRQEAALFAVPFAAVELRRSRGRAAALLPLIALAGWTAFRWSYYGRLLPMPWSVKKLPLADDWAYGLRYVWTSTLTSGIALLALVAPCGGRGGTPWRVAGIGVLVHTLYVVHVGGDFMALARFHVPVLPLAVLAAAGTLATRVRSARVRVAAGVALALAVQWVQAPWSFASARRHPLVLEQARRYRLLDHEGFEQRWARIGRRLREACPVGTRVATSPIGAIGWYSELALVDVLGLTNDSTLGVPPDLEGVAVKGHHRTNADWILALRPEVFVLGNGVLDSQGRLPINPWERSIYEHAVFQRDYVAMVLPMPEFMRAGEPTHDYGLPLWVRVDATPPRGAVAKR